MAIIKKYISRVECVTPHFPGIFTLSMRSLDKPYKYLPGQFLHLALDKYDPSAPWPESRCFSMQTCESDGMIKITYSVKGVFTGRMAGEIAAGKNLWLKLPYGELFSRPHSKDKTVFIAGGTGVTPFLSLFTSGLFAEYANPRLYLGVRSKDYYIYGREIAKAKEINPSFRAFIIDQEDKGMLDIARILNENPAGFAGSVFFISGPPVMTLNFKRYMLDKGVPEVFVRTDEWE